MVIHLDAGHGGADSGAIGPSGTKESDVVLNVCKAMARLLVEQEIDVYMTRHADDAVSLSRRVEFAHNNDADLFISIHCNSAANPSANGYECFTSHGDTPSDVLAEHVLKAYESKFPTLTNRGHKEAGFYVLTKTRMPAILFELEFIHNVQGESFLLSNIDNMAQALFNGAMTYLESQSLIPLDPPPTDLAPDEPIELSPRQEFRRDVNKALNKLFDAI